MTTDTKRKKDYITGDMLSDQYLGDSKASAYCKDIIRIENPTIRSAFAILIASGCKGSDVDNFILTLARADWRYIEILMQNKTPFSNATQLKVKLSKGFKIDLGKRVSPHKISDKLNSLSAAKT